MIKVSQRGNFNKTERFLNHAVKAEYLSILEKYGQEGVIALSNATPVDSGKTASSWYYKIEHTDRSYTITWCNSNVVDGVPVVVLIQYGHGTRNGGYVEGNDYIHPSIKPIFEELANAAWKEVTRL